MAFGRTKIARLADFVFGNSLFLFAGAVAALAWANLAGGSYDAFRHLRLPGTSWLSLHGTHGFSLEYLVNDILMAFFFALAGKEVWEAMLPGGSLRNIRKAATPIVCAVGGMAGPAGLYLLGAALLGQMHALSRGWAIPCATDIAFSYIVARLVFGKRHPATPFLLMLAIVDDALGLVVLAVFYPTKPVTPLWLLLPAAAVVIALLMRGRCKSFWWYLAGPGVISWIGFALSGLHPALGLLPIIPTLPHGRTADPQVHWEPTHHKDALDKFEAWWKRPVEVILGLFGLLNAGVALTSFGSVTFLVLAALVIGKPLGIFISGVLSVKVFRLHLPDLLSWKDLFVVGCVAGIGFTVAIFVTTVAFPSGTTQDAAKMGALGSFVAAAVAIAVAKAMRIRKWPAAKTDSPGHSS